MQKKFPKIYLFVEDFNPADLNNLNKNILPGKTMDSLLFEAELDNENLNRKLNRSNKAYTEMIESGI